MSLRNRLLALSKAWEHIAHRDQLDKTKRTTLLTCVVQLLETLTDKDTHSPRRIVHPNPTGAGTFDIGHFRGEQHPLEPSTCHPPRKLPEPRRTH